MKTTMQPTFKNKQAQDNYHTARTIKEYRVTFGDLVKYDLVVPVGSLVTNQTACGHNDNYRFLTAFNTKQLVGFDAPMLAHDLVHYGLNIPAEYCEPY